MTSQGKLAGVSAETWKLLLHSLPQGALDHQEGFSSHVRAALSTMKTEGRPEIELLKSVVWRGMLVPRAFSILRDLQNLGVNLILEAAAGGGGLPGAPPPPAVAAACRGSLARAVPPSPPAPAGSGGAPGSPRAREGSGGGAPGPPAGAAARRGSLARAVPPSPPAPAGSGGAPGSPRAREGSGGGAPGPPACAAARRGSLARAVPPSPPAPAGGPGAPPPLPSRARGLPGAPPLPAGAGEMLSGGKRMLPPSAAGNGRTGRRGTLPATLMPLSAGAGGAGGSAQPTVALPGGGLGPLPPRWQTLLVLGGAITFSRQRGPKAPLLLPWADLVSSPLLIKEAEEWKGASGEEMEGGLYGLLGVLTARGFLKIKE